MNQLLYWPRLLTVLFLAGAGVSLVAIGIETDWGRRLKGQHGLPTFPPATSPAAAMVPPYAQPALDSGFPESAARPLFMPNRRPVPSAAPAPVMKRGQFVLVGTSRTQAFGDSAMLKEMATGKTHVVRAGESIQDMTVKSVGPDRVVLAVGEETEEIVMRAANSPKQPPIAVGGPGPLGSSPGARPGGPGAGPGPTPAVPGMAARPAAPGPGPGPAQGQAPGSSSPQPQPPSTAAPTQPQSADGTGRLSPFEEILERRRRARAQQAQQPQPSP